MPSSIPESLQSISALKHSRSQVYAPLDSELPLSTVAVTVVAADVVVAAAPAVAVVIRTRASVGRLCHQSEHDMLKHSQC